MRTARKPLVGRKVICSMCAHKTVKGTSRVCLEFMDGVSKIEVTA